MFTLVVAEDERLIDAKRCVPQTLRLNLVHSFVVAVDERLIGAERCVPQTLRLSLVHSFVAVDERFILCRALRSTDFEIKFCSLCCGGG